MSQDPDGRVVVAGHICLDIIPAFETHHAPSGTLLTPGKLVNVGPALLSTGGAVSNTGLALHRLGVPTSLMGKIGDDLFGRAILDVIRGRDPSLADGMVVSVDAPSSYTIVISPPGIDRSFLHCPGANDTFGPEDVDVPRLAGTRIFHSAPPLMRRMHIDGGGELTALLRKVKEAGIATSLDLAHVDAHSPARTHRLTACCNSSCRTSTSSSPAWTKSSPSCSRSVSARLSSNTTATLWRMSTPRSCMT